MERYRVELLHGGDVMWCGEVVSHFEGEVRDAYLRCAAYDAYLKHKKSGVSLPLIELHMKVTKLSSVVKVRKIPKKQKGVKRWSGIVLMSTR